MLLRRAPLLALALAALACEPSVPYDPAAHNPSSVDYAAFDPTGNPPAIPLPNDLALQPSAIATQNPAQAALLNAFLASGGFPSDQEVPITIDFVRETLDPSTGAPTRSAPPLDTTSINAGTLALIGITSGGAGPVAYDAPKPADYVVNGDHGTLTLHKSPDPKKSNSRRYAPGKYIVAVRGGANGVKVTDGSAGFQAQPAMYLLLQDQDLTLPQNQGIIPGNTRADKAAAAAQLEALRKQYLLPFAAIDAAFSHKEVATMATFSIAPAVTHVETDAGAGLMPLPSDFLFASGHLLPALASPTGPFGALGPGLGTLDGFSTTAMELAATSGPIDATSVNGNSVFIYELNLAVSPPTARRLVDLAAAAGAGAPQKAEYVSEPPQITQAVSGGTCAAAGAGVPCASTAIGLQPAIPAAVGNTLATVPPLKEGTTYVVLVTDQVKDISGAPLGRSTLGQILLMDPTLKITSATGKSQISGVTDAQAPGLDQMRGAITLAAGTLAAEKGSAYGRSHIVMGYTFRTQTMKTTAVNLTALPYGTPNSTFAPVGTPKLYGVCPALGGACPDGTVADVFNAYGVDLTTVPHANITTIVEAQIVTFNGLDDATGAFKDLTRQQPTPEVITALIALPNLTCVPTATTPCSIPLTIFRHGFGGGRGDMLTVADTFNGQGIAVAAIDANKHGDRSFCSADAQCNGTCVAVASMKNQGDAAGSTPGKCSVDFLRRPVLCPTGGCATATLTKGIPAVSGNFLVGTNLFRTRDTLRQDLIDESQLIRVLSPNPACSTAAPATDLAHTCANQILTASTGFQIDNTKIWYVGISLGSISGTVDVAANPRIGKAAFSVGGGTIADLFTNSPAFVGNTNALLGTLGITPGTAAYLQFINVAKWILDPADPLNFATNLSAKTLPSPLSGNVAPPARKILAQVSNCDLTVPNPFNLELDLLSGLGPTSASTSTLEILTNSGDYSTVGGSCPTPEAAAGAGAVPHGILEDWGVVNGTPIPGLTAKTSQLQTDFAAFLLSDTQPPPVR